MGEYFNQIPVNLQEHIQDITRTSGLEYNDESIEKMAQAWIEKKNAFEEETSSQAMEDVTVFSEDDERGALVLTYSGSLLSVGPLQKGVRRVEYSSIGIRSDVPASAVGERSVLGDDIEIDKEVTFKSGPIKNTSLVYKLAVCEDELSAEAQLETLNNATVALEEEFTNINKTIIL
jgi:hypothetical protein